MADTIQLDVPLFIRLLELAREEIKDDADIHDLAQRAIELSKNGPVDMSKYNELVRFMKKQGAPAEEEFAPDDIRRFRQIIDLANSGEPTEYSNTPKEEYAAIDSVTSSAGGGMNSPKHIKDIRGDSLRVYGDN